MIANRLLLASSILVLAIPSVAAAGPLRDGAACISDLQCLSGSRCTNSVCVRSEKKKQLFPFSFSRGERDFLFIGPYVHATNRRTESSTHFFIPLVATHTAPDYHVTVQFPFFWRVHDHAETDTVVFPFYGRMRAPGRAVDLLFPIFFRSKSNVASTTIVGPFYRRARTDGGGASGLFPLFHYGKSLHGGVTSRWFGSPLVYWAQNDHTGHRDLWAGPFYDMRRPNGYDAGLVPLFFAWRRGTSSKIVMPLFYHERDPAIDHSLDVVTLFYFGHTAKRRFFGLAPIFFGRAGGDGTGSGLLLPLLFYKKKQHGSLLATVLFGYSIYPEGTRAYVGPFYYRSDREAFSTALFPLVYHSHSRTTPGVLTNLVAPFYFDRRGADGQELSAYTPLIWRYHSIEGSVVAGLPLFFDVHRYGESRSTGVLPFYIRSRSNVTHSTWQLIPPLLTWTRSRPKDEGEEGRVRDLVAFPLVWYFGGARSTTVVFPFGWDFRRGESRTVVFAPFGAHWKRSDGEHTLFLNMYYRRGKGPKEGSWYVNVFPLCSFGKPARKDIEWSLFEGLVGYSRIGRNRMLHLLFFFDIRLEPLPASALTWFGSTPTSARTEF